MTNYKNCEICSCLFKARNRKERHYKIQKFCSLQCYRKWREGKDFSRGNGWLKGHIPWNKNIKTPDYICKKISLAHKNKPKPHKLGKKNYFYKGGITKLVNRIRQSMKYKIWHDNIFQRDNFICQKCYVYSKKGNRITLHAHHIKEFSVIFHNNNIKTYEDALNCNELWDVNNGITLCIKCHKLIHKNKVLELES